MTSMMTPKQLRGKARKAVYAFLHDEGFEVTETRHKILKQLLMDCFAAERAALDVLPKQNIGTQTPTKTPTSDANTPVISKKPVKKEYLSPVSGLTLRDQMNKDLGRV